MCREPHASARLQANAGRVVHVTATDAAATKPSVPRTVAQTMLGRPADWQLRRPHIGRPSPGLHWLGPLTVLGTILLSWPAFAGAIGEHGESVQFGLFIGAVSIVLMAWSFLLALRVRHLERFFGGLDSMYRVHRWAGTLAVVAMFLHTQIEPEIENGVRGASRSVADAAEDLAGTGELMLYILVLMSIVRWMPYRFWRLSHKLLGIPFVFASWHFFTSEKPYANGSGWGWYFGTAMVVGIVAFVLRVLIRDPLLRGSKHRVASAEVLGDTVELVLEPMSAALGHRSGQFAVLKLQRRGMTEPHIFTIASGPSEGVLRFFIKDLGDWTSKLVGAGSDLVGSEVIVEGPYGRFRPLPHAPATTVWVAGGVGITPFLAATAELEPRPEGQRPVLYYAVRDEYQTMAIETLKAAADRGVIDLEMCSSSEGRRFGASLLVDRFGPDGLHGAHMAVCGPAGLVAAVRQIGASVGAAEVEHEDFDIRQGFGPDLSRPIAELVTELVAR